MQSVLPFNLRGFYSLWLTFPGHLARVRSTLVLLQLHLLYPKPTFKNGCSLTINVFRLFPFRSPLLRESQLISFPRGT